MAIGDLFRLSAIGQGPQGQELVNRWVFKQTLALILDTPGEDLVQAFQENVEADYRFTFSAACKIMGYEVRGITDETYGFDFAYAGGSEPVGSRGGQMLPPQSSVVIKWVTGLIGRSFRGRTYLWPMGEADQSGGVVETATLGDLDTFVTKMIELGIGPFITTATWQLGVYSTVEDSAPRVPPIFTPCIGGVARTKINTQMRRVAGVGS